MVDMTTHIFNSNDDVATGTTFRHTQSINDCAPIIGEMAKSPSSGFCCLVSDGLVPDIDSLSTATSQMESADATICILTNSRHHDLKFIWNRLPSTLAGFVTPPESRAAIILNTARKITVPLQSPTVDWPLQELVIRTALQNGEAVIAASPFDSADCSPLPNASSSLPALAPRHPGKDRRWIAQLLNQLTPQQHFNGTGDDCENAAILAGLFLLNDYLDESHNHSQSIQGQGADANGDYWHGIMHRREPDYGNSKYWFRRVGDHPCFKQLPALAEQAFNECDSPDADHWKSRLIIANEWDAAAFVDLCEAAEQTSDDELAITARRLQWSEMLLLLEHTYRQASGH